MLTKSISATIGVVLLPILFSVIGGQDEVVPIAEQDLKATSIAQVPQEKSLWAKSNATSSRSSFFGLTSNRRSEDQKINEAAKALRQATTSDDKTAAIENLTNLLSADYDSRLAEYDAYLDSLEQQLASMRDKLLKRREAKLKMIELRIKVLEAEADDLGWPSRIGRGLNSQFPSRFGLESRDPFSEPARLPALIAPKKAEQPAQPAQPRAGR